MIAGHTDMATVPKKVQIKRTSTSNTPPVGLLPGELAVEMASPLRLWVGVPTLLDPSEKKLLIDMTFPTNGAAMSDTAPSFPAHGTLWFETDTGILWVYYMDGTSNQWVQVGGPRAL